MKKILIKNPGLKLTALILALALWYYVVGELKRGSEEDMRFMNRVLPSEGIVTKKLLIRPIIVGKPKRGYFYDSRTIVTVPDYCIVVGTKELLDKVRVIYTMPIDISAAYKPITKSVALNPIAPGVFMEDTQVQVTVPVEKEVQ
jgi:YbbR domain-containing protein